jgi:hypothetical protein
MKKTFVLVIWFALAVPSVAHAQGEWLQKGVSGVGAQVDLSHAPNATTLGLTGSYSHQGFLDAGVTLGWIDTSVAEIPDLSTYSLTLQLAYHPLKQSKQMPLSVSVAMGYTQTFFSSDTLRENDASLSAWAFTLLGGAYRFFPVAERIGVIPQIELGWSHNSVSQMVLDRTQTDTEDLFVIELKPSLAYLDPGGHVWGVSPTVSFGPGNTPTAFGISVTFISTLAGLR